MNDKQFQDLVSIELTPEQYMSIGAGNLVLIDDSYVVKLAQIPSLRLEIHQLARRLGYQLEAA